MQAGPELNSQAPHPHCKALICYAIGQPVQESHATFRGLSQGENGSTTINRVSNWTQLAAHKNVARARLVHLAPSLPGLRKTLHNLISARETLGGIQSTPCRSMGPSPRAGGRPRQQANKGTLMGLRGNTTFTGDL
jgi:hypothetical protein